jgi:hypothetical protein
MLPEDNAKGPERPFWRAGVTGPISVAVAGIALQVIAGVLPYQTNSPVTPFDAVGADQVPWIIDPNLAPLILAVIGTVALLVRPVRGFGAGMLFLTGVLFYVADIQGLVDFQDPFAQPGYGEIVSLMSDVILVAAGMLAASTTTVVPSLRSWLLSWRVLGVVASLAALIAAIGTHTTAFSASFWPFLLFPVALGIVGVVNSAYLRDATVRFGAGVLFALGFVELGYFLPSFPSEFARQPWTAIGVGAGIAVMVVGLVASVRTGRPGLPVTQAPYQPDDSGTHYPDMTRYLCAAAHLDSEFAQQTVRRVVDDRGRAPAPSVDVDLGVVLRHCLGAYRRQRVRSVARDLIGLAVLLLVIAFLFGRHDVVDLGYAGLLIVLAWLVMAMDIWVGRYRIAARTLSRATFDPHRTPAISGAEELDVATAAAKAANVTIYGGYLPFVGSGIEQGGWSFALSVLKGKQVLGNDSRLTPAPFELDGLYEAVQRDVEALQLDGAGIKVAVEDRLYVDGQGLHGDRRFVLPEGGMLRAQVSDEELRAFVRSPELVNRVYRCIRIHGWRSEFVLSVYLNFARTGSGLFTQARYFLLLPLKEDYLSVDHFDPDMSTVQTLTEAARGAARPGELGRLLLAPFSLFGAISPEIHRRRTRNTTPKRDFNYGATVSIRELAQANGYRKYFQQLDRDMIGKIVERQILDSVVGFLDSHHIDTSELEERQTAILNNGLIVSGGNVEADSLAVGTGAKSTVGRLASRLIGDD